MRPRAIAPDPQPVSPHPPKTRQTPPENRSIPEYTGTNPLPHADRSRRSPRRAGDPAAPLPPNPVELSSKMEYACLALIELAGCYQDAEPLQIRQIAAQQHIPDRYLEQLLATLRRGGLVRSQRGAKGGYVLAQDPWQVSLLDVFHCLEGGEVGSSQDDRTGQQTAERSVMREIWQEAETAMCTVLERQTLQDLVDRCNACRQADLMYYI